MFYNFDLTKNILPGSSSGTITVPISIEGGEIGGISLNNLAIDAPVIEMAEERTWEMVAKVVLQENIELWKQLAAI